MIFQFNTGRDACTHFIPISISQISNVQSDFWLYGPSLSLILGFVVIVASVF